MTGNNKQSEKHPTRREKVKEKEREGMEKGTKNGKREGERERSVCCLPASSPPKKKLYTKLSIVTQPPDFPCDRFIRPNFRFLYRNRVSSRLIRIYPREIIRRLGVQPTNEITMSGMYAYPNNAPPGRKLLHRKNDPRVNLNLILFSRWQHHFEKGI